MESVLTTPRARRLAVAFLFLALCLVASSAALLHAGAQPPNYISGSACLGGPNPKWQSGDTWIMYGNVTVSVGCTLTIEPGATVKADPGVTLFVNGTLLSDGRAGSPVNFLNNQTAVTPWAGIRFNSGSAGSVAWSNFSRVTVAIFANASSPAINNNTVVQAAAGVRLDNSNSLVADNVIDGRKNGAYGILVASSSSRVVRNAINGTSIGIQAMTGGSPILANNTITNVSGGLAIGIYVEGLGSVAITGNTIRGGLGSNGPTAASGATAIGILVNGTSGATIEGNGIADLHGGRGGPGANTVFVVGGRGGEGGGAAGIAIGNAGTILIRGNTIATLFGGRGGLGGSSGATDGGRGGAGGTVMGVVVFSASVSSDVSSNTVSNLMGGIGGDGGSRGLSGRDGSGGPGGTTYGVFAVDGMNPDLSSNIVGNLKGGLGGNSTASASGSNGGPGGETDGLIVLAVGSATVHANTVTSILGGAGGLGVVNGGFGGNATAIFALGSGRPYNSSVVSFNSLSNVAGGTGGIGGKLSGDGGLASGIFLLHVNASSASNSIDGLVGGAGGDAFILTNQASRGGEASGLSFLGVPSGFSSLDTIQSVTKGAAGSGAAPRRSWGVGAYFLGDGTATTRATLTNASLIGVGDLDLYVDNYTEATAVNTLFGSSKLAVESAGNLTVRNFLDVNVFWPNNTTLVAGASVLVDDNGGTAYNLSTPNGQARWLLVTDRIYINSKIPTENATSVTVGYGGYGFFANPRAVNMSTSHLETFGMVDTSPPLSQAATLPAYESARTFTVDASYTDGNGTGVRNVTLWYRYNGGGWISYQTLVPAGALSFTFAASADGTYEFTTTSADNAGNVQPLRPLGNDTWTIVDTSRPGSVVQALPPYETSLNFLVAWGPVSGTTDIATYRIEYNRGTGWLAWFGDTTLTSATFTATTQGTYQFRSIASDRANNVELKSGNDTWTVVDTVPPASAVAALPAYERVVAFAVSWSPAGGTADAANYSIQVSVDGGSWTTWFAGARNASATFTGADGHRYAFRSLATDRAGNVESKSANDTWTIVDTTTPSSAVAALPRYEAVLTFAVSWGPAGSTSDVATYTIQTSQDGGAWTPLSGNVNTTALGATFTGADGHRYAFRSLATDRAGNVESKSANDTWTIVDVTRPTVVTGIPEGSGVNSTPPIIVTFSEPMDPSSTERAFTLSPAMNGAFAWSNDGKVLTFTPARALEAGTTYTVVIDTSAKDLAGNNLLSLKTFTFTTTSTFGILDWWPLFLVLALVAGGVLILLLRRRGSAAKTATKPVVASPSPATVIDDVFLLYKDGVLIKHETLRLRPDIDTDILSGMLTAVQQFVKDSFQGDEEGDLNEITVGQMHLHIGKGMWLILAARVSGGDVTTMNDQIKKCIADMEEHEWDQLEGWDGDMTLARVMAPYLKRLIRGEYA